MTVAFVLGNGISRQGLDLPGLKTQGRVYGCNAIYREFEPDVLISTDTPISERIQQEGYSKGHVHYTRKPLPDSGAKKITKEYFGFSSGPVAVAQAAQDGARDIYLLGFDMGPTGIGRFNNVYADTEFYRKSAGAPTYTGNWIRQLVTIAKDYPNINFFRVVGETTAEIKELLGVNNLTHQSIADFQNKFSISAKI